MRTAVHLYLAPVLLLGLSPAPPALAQHDHTHDEVRVSSDANLGTVDFSVDCAEEVRADFDLALGLMHHMMYEQARGLFESIAEADPDCAMARWGVATTLFQPLWGTRPSEEDLQRGWRNISEAAERVENSRERALIAATRAFFRDPDAAAFRDRIRGWAEGIAAAWEAYPDDLDVAALQGLALLTRAQYEDRRNALHDEAEAILREVWEAEPAHPGAIHYSIHATDAEGRAENALEMVEAYSEIAPEVPHALHMPTHIYVRLGDWPAVIDWNRRSAEAALDYPVDDSVSHHYIHAIDYLVYAHLQRGEDKRADTVFYGALDRGRHQPSFISAYHFAALPARLAVERRDWQQAADIVPRRPDYLPWDESYWPEGLSWFARGLGALHNGDPDEARRAEARLADLRDTAREADDARMATYIEIDRRILDGWMTYAEGDLDQGIETLRSAAQLEGTVEKHPVAPGALLPPYEALGDLLMEGERPAEALDAYEAADDVWPERYNTLLGAARAAVATGDEEAAREHYSGLVELAGDSDRDGIAEAHGWLGQARARTPVR